MLDATITDRPLWSRRMALAAGLMAPLSVLTGAQAEEASVDNAALRFRVIVVDTSRLVERGLSSTAAIVSRQLGADAGEIFADRLAPHDTQAPQLVIRIDSIQLASYAGGSTFSQMGDPSNTDYLEGVGLVMAGKRILSTTPIMSALDASYSGAWYAPDIDARRIASISHHFAYWLRREMGV